MAISTHQAAIPTHQAAIPTHLKTNNIPQEINSRDRLSLRICVGVDSVSIDEAVHLGFFLFVARLAGQTIGTGLCSNEGYATCDWNGVRRLDSVVLATCFKIAGEP